MSEFGDGHVLIYGQTGAGKSSYLKYVIADKAVSQEIPLIIYDPFLDSGWPEGAEIFDSTAKFFKRVWEKQNCWIIHDEAGDGSKRNVELEKLAIQARHLGHKCHFAAQRPQQIATTVRGQCSTLVTFKVVPRDADFLAEEFGDERLLKAASLKPLTYIHADRWGDIYTSELVFPD